MSERKLKFTLFYGILPIAHHRRRPPTSNTHSDIHRKSYIAQFHLIQYSFVLFIHVGKYWVPTECWKFFLSYNIFFLPKATWVKLCAFISFPSKILINGHTSIKTPLLSYKLVNVLCIIWLCKIFQAFMMASSFLPTCAHVRTVRAM